MSTDTNREPGSAETLDGRPISNPVVLQVDPGRVLKVLVITCVVVEFSLMFFDYHINYARWTEIGAIRRMFNITREDGLASFVAVAQTLLVALTVWLIYSVYRAKDVGRLVRWSWFVFAALFTYMAIDDGSAVHERVATAVQVIQKRALDSGSAGALGFPSYTWHVVFLPFFATLGFYMFVFLFQRMRRPVERLCLILGIGAFVFAVGLDFVEGLEPEHPWNLYTTLSVRYEMDAFTQERFRATPYNTIKHFSKSVEEAAEMFGMTLLWTAFLSHLFGITGSLVFRFGANSSPDRQRRKPVRQDRGATHSAGMGLLRRAVSMRDRR